MAQDSPSSFTVILVDRNRHIRELLARELTREGFTVLCCGLGREAVDMAARGDIMVLDSELPDMDVSDIIHTVHEMNPGLPIAVHAHGEDEAGFCLDERLVFFVPRGADPAILIQAVRMMLEMAGAADPAVRAQGTMGKA